MSITNISKPTTSLTNVTKVSFAETWASIPTTWATETRTWLATGSLFTNTSKPILNSIKSAGTVVNTDAGGGDTTDAWSNPSNATASDNVYATCDIGTLDYSDYLDASNFGFTIPTSAQIIGVKVEIERKASDIGLFDNRIILLSNSAEIGTNQSVTGMLPTTDSYATYGGNASLWGAILTPSIVNDSTFGVRYQVVTTLDRVASVDHIQMMIYYTNPGSITNISKP